MRLTRNQWLLRFLACCLLICALIVSSPRAAFAQATDSTTEHWSVPNAHPLPEQTGENQEPRNAPESATNGTCSVGSFTHETWTEGSQFAHGLKAVPRGMVRTSNLKWELPILAATGVLIAKVDRPADNRIQSQSFRQTAGQWSNVGLGLELGSGTVAYAIGCSKHHAYLRDSGFKALAAMGAAGAIDLGLKLAFDREYPTKPGSTGKFWAGGRAFPSGHSATSFAFAAVIAHRYPTNKWIKWGAYALATGVSLSRYPAKTHYPSDILVGATLGYVVGTYLADH
jgi:hypothetical protein